MGEYVKNDRSKGSKKSKRENQADKNSIDINREDTINSEKVRYKNADEIYK